MIRARFYIKKRIVTTIIDLQSGLLSTLIGVLVRVLIALSLLLMLTM